MSAALLLGSLSLIGPAELRASDVQQEVAVDANTWAGKKIVLSARAPARFMSYSRAKMSFGLFGLAAAAVQGDKLIEQNGIGNPASQLVNALFAAASAPDGPAANTLAPLPADSSDAASIARAAHGADLVFDVRLVSWSLEPLLQATDRYFVTQEFQFQVIDVASGKILRAGSCVRTTQRDSQHPTREELLDDHAKGLKTVLDAQRGFCLQYFEVIVLGLPPSKLPDTPGTPPPVEAGALLRPGSRSAKPPALVKARWAACRSLAEGRSCLRLRPIQTPGRRRPRAPARGAAAFASGSFTTFSRLG